MQSQLGTGHLKRFGSHHLCQLFYLFFWLENNILPKGLQGFPPVFRALSRRREKRLLTLACPTVRPHVSARLLLDGFS